MNPELLFQNNKILNSMAILFCLAVRKTLKILLYSFPNGDGLQVQQ